MRRQKTRNLIGFAIFAWLAMGVAGPALGDTHQVGTAQPHLTIDDAVNAATDGDEVEIVDATHTECGVVIHKNITIKGHGADQTIIQGASTPLTACGPVFIVSMGYTVTIKDLTIRYGYANGAYPNDRGGAIYNDYGTLTVQDCVITDNYTTLYGGGICTYGNMTMNRCTLSNNTAVRGGGGLEFGNSNGDRTITITNSTFSGNSATRFDGHGGGIDFLVYPYIVTVTMTNCTLADNTVTDGVSGNGIYLDSAGTFTLNLTNCILSNGTSANYAISGFSNAPTINRSYTLVRDASLSAYAGSGNLDSTDPLLDPLADYGGSLTTCALGVGSPCVDAGTSTGAPSVDERGTARPSGAGYDIGAFEAVVPTVTSIAASNITAATAKAGGTVVLSSGTLMARGVCWSTSANPTILDSYTTGFVLTGTQLSQLTGLSAGTLYHFRAYGMTAEGVSYGADMTFTTASLPTVTTTAISSITASTAASGGTIAAYAIKPVTARGVCWSAMSSPTIADAHTSDGTGVGIFTSSLAGLAQGTTYYVRAYATTSEGTSYGNEVSFTPAELPTLSTTAVSNIAVTTADSGGNVADEGGVSVTDRGVCWNTATAPTTANSHTSDGTGAGTFASNLTGLTQGTLYYVRAYAINSVGTAYGDEISFTTNDVPAVTTTAVSYINPSTAATGGDVTSDGGSAVTARGICWGTSANPTIAGSHTHDSTGTGSFASSITSLTPNTTYHVRAYATNSLGTGYGGDIPFVTSVTTASVILTGVSNITYNSATWGGTVTADGGAAVTARGTCWSTSANPTTGDSHTTDGAGTGAFTSSLTSLTAHATYHVRAYATNSEGTAYSDDVTFVCAPATATLTTRAASNISSSTADSGGDVSNDGGATVTAVGVCWNTTGSPTIDDSHAVGAVAAGFTASLSGLSPGVLYYVRAYATNSAGTAYGNQVSFTTLTLTPTVTTASVSNITVTTADCGGTVTSDGNAAVTARGVCWGTAANPTTAGSHTHDGTGTGAFTSAITGLTAYTTYHVRAYATNSQGTSYGSDVTFISLPTTPTLTTRAASNIASTTADSGGDVSANGGSAVTACGICWNTGGSPTLSDGHAGGTVAAGFTASLTGLSPGVLYYVRAYAINAIGVAYGNQVSFTTLTLTPTVTTASVSNIAVTTADCGGTVTSDGSAAVTARGVCWGTAVNPTIAGSHTTDGTGTGAFTSAITGLTAGTTYHVRAYATNSQGTSYGADVTFVSLATTPTLTTRAASNIAGTTADSGGDVTSTGGSAVIACGVCWNTGGSPTLSNNYASVTVAAGFTATLTGLSPGTLYHIRSYAINAAGTAYGNDLTFTTLSLTPTVTTASVSNITASTADCGGTVSSDGSAAVTARGVCWGTAANPTIAGSHTTDGTGTGSFTSAITGLTACTTYHVRAYATNSQGTSYGSDLTFISLPTIPTLTTRAASNIASTTADSGGDVSANGGSAVTACGVCWNTTGTPTLDNSHASGAVAAGFTAALTGLSPGVLYYVRAYAINTVGVAYGAQVSFTTLTTLPTVTTAMVSGVNVTSVTCGGTVTSDGSAAVSARGVCWGTAVNPTIAGSHTTDGTGTGSFTSSITGLTAYTTYHVRAYATNSQGTAYGADASFVTNPTIPTLTTRVASNITASTADSGGDVSTDGGSALTACGICWNTTGSPTLDNSHASGTVAAGFTAAMSSLSPGVLYYVRAYTINAIGVAYGNQVSFTTLTTLPTVTTAMVSSVNVTSVSCGGTVTSDGSAAVSARGVCWGTAVNPTIASSHTTDGAGTGSFTSSITGLTAYTTYHVRAYATNSQGTAYGADASFVTNPTIPTLTTRVVSNITASTADSGGDVSTDGGSALTACGVCWNTGGSPTLDDGHASGTVGAGFTAALSGMNPGVLYYVRAYAINSVGVAYGTEVSFTTLSTVPTVTTAAVSSVDVTSVASGGTVTSDGSAAVTERGVCWGTSVNPTIAGSHTHDGTGIGSFTSSITGLVADTTYHARAYATNSHGTSYGADVPFVTNPTTPTLTTRAASSITATTADSGGDISSDGGLAVVACGVCWNTAGSPTLSDDYASATLGAGFTATLTDLSPGVLYHIRSYAINSAGTAYGNDVSFTTLGTVATVTTAAVSNIATTTADCGGNVTDDGSAAIMARGVCWNTATAPTIANSHTTDGTGTGAFSSNLAGLTQGTLYHVRAYATNSAGTAYGSETSFTTNGIPTVTTTAVSYIDPDAAVTGGTVTSEGGVSVTARGICWGASANPTIVGSHTHDGTGAGVFVSDITGLTPNTTYHVRAYATNSLGTAYGSDIPFATAVTTPTVVLTGVSNITATAATWGGTVAADGGSSVLAKGTCWSTSANPTIAGSHTSDGTGTGTFTSSLTGLTAHTTYHVRGYATNAQGTAYSDDVTFVSVPAIATLTTRAATDIMAVSATSGGDITSEGGASVTACGVCWNRTGNPTLSDNHVSGTVAAGFDVELADLLPGTVYYVRAYAINTAGPAYGSQITFTTLSAVPGVTTGAVSNIGVYSAECGGTVTDDGGAPVTARGICWSTSANPTMAGAHTEDGTGLGGFTGELTGLSPHVTYHVRAYATNSIVTSYGSDLTFTTLGTIPTVSAASVVALDIHTATSGGNVSADGGISVTARGLCWSTSANPTITDSHTADGTGTGTFSSTLTGLTPDVLYHLRAYATNSLGTAYSADATFTIPGDLPTLTTTVILSIASTRASSGGTVVSDGGTPVLARGVCWSSSPQPTVDSEKTIDGAGIGTFASSITDLRADTTYYVRAYATNSAGAGYGGEQVFTTSIGPAPFVFPCGAAGISTLTLTIAGMLGMHRRRPGRPPVRR